MKRKILFAICLLFGLLFVNAGLNKFFNYMPAPDKLPSEMEKLMQAILEIGWLLPLVGVGEIIGGILFVFPRTRALGAIIIFPITTGILLTNIINFPSGLPMALFLMVVDLWVVFEHRDIYLPMLAHG